jgi:hypothetical protein
MEPKSSYTTVFKRAHHYSYAIESSPLLPHLLIVLFSEVIRIKNLSPIFLTNKFVLINHVKEKGFTIEVLIKRNTTDGRRKKMTAFAD